MKSFRTMGNLGLALLCLILTTMSWAGRDHDDDNNNEKCALSVMVLGSGGPIATASGRASAGYLIFVNDEPRILMDVGGGTYQRVAKSGVNLHALDTI